MRVAAAGLVAGASAEWTFQNCGDETAHLKNFESIVSPDPPVPGKPVTMTFRGGLDEDLSKGSILVTAGAGPITIPTMTIPFEVTPKILAAGGDVHVQVGPFEYPNVHVPIIPSVTAHVEMHDGVDETVFCVDANLPAATKQSNFLEASVGTETDPFQSCSSSDAHIRNIVVDVDPPQPKKGESFTVAVQGDLDEELTSGIVEVDVNVVLFTLKLRIPYDLLDGRTIPAVTGVKAKVGPILLPDIPLIPNVKGSVRVTEQNGEEVACVQFDTPVAESVEV